MKKLRFHFTLAFSALFFLAHVIFPYSLEANSLPIPHRNAALLSGIPFENLTIRASASLMTPKYSQFESYCDVIHIQDIHVNSEAQYAIAADILERIQKGSISLVALEGAFGPLSFDSFHRFPHPGAVQVAAQGLLKNGDISGPIYSALVSGSSKIPFVGVDDKNLYEKNIRAYRASSGKTKETKEELDQLEQANRFLKKNRFNPELLRWDAIVESYRQENLPIGEYVKKLSEESSEIYPSIEIYLASLNIEEKLNFKLAETERSRLIQSLVSKMGSQELSDFTLMGKSLKSGKISEGQFYASLLDLAKKKRMALSSYKTLDDYIRYLRLTDELDSERLLSDVQVLENHVLAHLAKTDQEKDLLTRSRLLHLAQKLITFSLSPLEWKEYSSRPLGLSLPEIKSFESFYTTAEARDEKMAMNLLLARRSIKSSAPMVLITGGFHTEGIGAYLSRAGLKVRTLTPRITRIQKENETHYLTSFDQEKTPLERLFNGNKLFLSPQGWDSRVILGACLAVAGSAVAMNGALNFQKLFQSLSGIAAPILAWGGDGQNVSAVILNLSQGMGLFQAQFQAAVSPNSLLFLGSSLSAVTWDLDRVWPLLAASPFMIIPLIGAAVAISRKFVRGRASSPGALAFMLRPIQHSSFGIYILSGLVPPALFALMGAGEFLIGMKSLNWINGFVADSGYLALLSDSLITQNYIFSIISVATFFLWTTVLVVLHRKGVWIWYGHLYRWVAVSSQQDADYYARYGKRKIKEQKLIDFSAHYYSAVFKSVSVFSAAFFLGSHYVNFETALLWGAMAHGVWDFLTALVRPQIRLSPKTKSVRKIMWGFIGFNLAVATFTFGPVYYRFLIFIYILWMLKPVVWAALIAGALFLWYSPVLFRQTLSLLERSGKSISAQRKLAVERWRARKISPEPVINNREPEPAIEEPEMPFSNPDPVIQALDDLLESRANLQPVIADSAEQPTEPAAVLVEAGEADVESAEPAEVDATPVEPAEIELELQDEPSTEIPDYPTWEEAVGSGEVAAFEVSEEVEAPSEPVTLDQVLANIDRVKTHLLEQIAGPDRVNFIDVTGGESATSNPRPTSTQDLARAGEYPRTPSDDYPSEAGAYWRGLVQSSEPEAAPQQQAKPERDLVSLWIDEVLSGPWEDADGLIVKQDGIIPFPITSHRTLHPASDIGEDREPYSTINDFSFGRGDNLEQAIVEAAGRAARDTTKAQVVPESQRSLLVLSEFWSRVVTFILESRTEVLPGIKFEINGEGSFVSFAKARRRFNEPHLHVALLDDGQQIRLFITDRPITSASEMWKLQKKSKLLASFLKLLKNEKEEFKRLMKLRGGKPFSRSEFNNLPVVKPAAAAIVNAIQNAVYSARILILLISVPLFSLLMRTNLPAAERALTLANHVQSRQVDTLTQPWKKQMASDASRRGSAEILLPVALVAALSMVSLPFALETSGISQILASLPLGGMPVWTIQFTVTTLIPLILLASISRLVFENVVPKIWRDGVLSVFTWFENAAHNLKENHPIMGRVALLPLYIVYIPLHAMYVFGFSQINRLFRIVKGEDIGKLSKIEVLFAEAPFAVQVVSFPFVAAVQIIAQRVWLFGQYFLGSQIILGTVWLSIKIFALYFGWDGSLEDVLFEQFKEFNILGWWQGAEAAHTLNRSNVLGQAFVQFFSVYGIMGAAMMVFIGNFKRGFEDIRKKDIAAGWIDPVLKIFNPLGHSIPVIALSGKQYHTNIYWATAVLAFARLDSVLFINLEIALAKWIGSFNPLLEYWVNKIEVGLLNAGTDFIASAGLSPPAASVPFVPETEIPAASATPLSINTQLKPTGRLPIMMEFAIGAMLGDVSGEEDDVDDSVETIPLKENELKESQKQLDQLTRQLDQLKDPNAQPFPRVADGEFSIVYENLPADIRSRTVGMLRHPETGRWDYHLEAERVKFVERNEQGQLIYKVYSQQGGRTVVTPYQVYMRVAVDDFAGTPPEVLLALNRQSDEIRPKAVGMLQNPATKSWDYRIELQHLDRIQQNEAGELIYLVKGQAYRVFLTGSLEDYRAMADRQSPEKVASLENQKQLLAEKVSKLRAELQNLQSQVDQQNFEMMDSIQHPIVERERTEIAWNPETSEAVAEVRPEVPSLPSTESESLSTPAFSINEEISEIPLVPVIEPVISFPDEKQPVVVALSIPETALVEFRPEADEAQSIVNQGELVAPVVFEPLEIQERLVVSIPESIVPEIDEFPVASVSLDNVETPVLEPSTPRLSGAEAEKARVRYDEMVSYAEDRVAGVRNQIEKLERQKDHLETIQSLKSEREALTGELNLLHSEIRGLEDEAAQLKRSPFNLNSPYARSEHLPDLFKRVHRGFHRNGESYAVGLAWDPVYQLWQGPINSNDISGVTYLDYLGAQEKARYESAVRKLKSDDVVLIKNGKLLRVTFTVRDRDFGDDRNDIESRRGAIGELEKRLGDKKDAEWKLASKRRGINHSIQNAQSNRNASLSMEEVSASLEQRQLELLEGEEYLAHISRMDPSEAVLVIDPVKVEMPSEKVSSAPLPKVKQQKIERASSGNFGREFLNAAGMSAIAVALLGAGWFALNTPRKFSMDSSPSVRALRSRQYVSLLGLIVFMALSYAILLRHPTFEMDLMAVGFYSTILASAFFVVRILNFQVKIYRKKLITNPFIAHRLIRLVFVGMAIAAIYIGWDPLMKATGIGQENRESEINQASVSTLNPTMESFNPSLHQESSARRKSIIREFSRKINPGVMGLFVPLLPQVPYKEILMGMVIVGLVYVVVSFAFIVVRHIVFRSGELIVVPVIDQKDVQILNRLRQDLPRYLSQNVLVVNLASNPAIREAAQNAAGPYPVVSGPEWDGVVNGYSVDLMLEMAEDHLSKNSSSRSNVLNLIKTLRHGATGTFSTVTNNENLLVISDSLSLRHRSIQLILGIWLPMSRSSVVDRMKNTLLSLKHA